MRECDVPVCHMHVVITAPAGTSIKRKRASVNPMKALQIDTASLQNAGITTPLCDRVHRYRSIWNIVQSEGL